MAGLGPEPPEKVNYRSIGRGDGGVGRKPRHNYYWDPDHPTPSTIPSQYETKLYRNNRESKGFSSRATRFDVRRAGQTPGPGSYRGEAVDIVRPNFEGCAGTRGSGPFASRGRRLEASKAGAPVGPGAYETRLQSPRRPVEAPSAAFAQPGAANPELWAAPPSPGPGDYLGPDHAVSARGPVRPVRITIPKDGAVAPPKTARGADDSAAAGGRQLEALASAGWAPPSPAARQRPPPKPRDTSDAEKRRLFEKLAGAGWEQQKGSSSHPGPADYDPGAAANALKGQTHFNVAGSSSFRVGTSAMPRSYHPVPPGPGHYGERELSPPPSPSGAPIGKAARWVSRPGVAPGPAYYTPRPKEAQQSFHLNIQRNWV